MNPSRTDLKILWGSPLPPTRSGVADYAMELLPELAKLARVRVLAPPEWDAPADWPTSLEIVPSEHLPDTDEVVLLHLGNNPHHLWLLSRLRISDRVVVVLHDTVLHHLLVESTEARGDESSFARALQAAHGAAGQALCAARAAGHHGRLDPFLLPARGYFLDGVRAVLVHSIWAEGLIQSEQPGLAVGRIALAVEDPFPVDRATVRTVLRLAPEDAVLMHLGFLTQEKGIEEIITGLAAAVKSGVPARLVAIGEGEAMEPLRNAAARVGVDNRLVVTGWIEPEHFRGLPAAADLGVVLRTPSAGETSAAALRFLSCGVPVAVGGNRQFLEWPETAAPRLTPGPSAPADLARLLAEVGGPGWDDRRLAARAVYLGSHRPEQAAKATVAFLDQIDFG